MHKKSCCDRVLFVGHRDKHTSPIFASIESIFSYNFFFLKYSNFFKDGLNESNSRWAPKILSPWSDIEQSSDSLSQPGHTFCLITLSLFHFITPHIANFYNGSFPSLSFSLYQQQKVLSFSLYSKFPCGCVMKFTLW